MNSTGMPLAVSTRFVARAADLGFDTPEVPLRVRIHDTGEMWRLTVMCALPHPLAEVAAWLEPYHPRRIEIVGDRAVRAEFPDPPATWRATFSKLDVDMMQLTPDGNAVVQVTGPRSAVAAFARRLTANGQAPVVKRLTRAATRTNLLTPSQAQALRVAVESGYYDIPRPLNLHQLAAKLGVTSASLSERLRRAEGRVIKSFMHRPEEPWDELPVEPPPGRVPLPLEHPPVRVPLPDVPSSMSEGAKAPESS